jgi:hypothetical protein
VDALIGLLIADLTNRKITQPTGEGGVQHFLATRVASLNQSNDGFRITCPALVLLNCIRRHVVSLKLEPLDRARIVAGTHSTMTFDTSREECPSLVLQVLVQDTPKLAGCKDFTWENFPLSKKYFHFYRIFLMTCHDL